MEWRYGNRAGEMFEAGGRTVSLGRPAIAAHRRLAADRRKKTDDLLDEHKPFGVKWYPENASIPIPRPTKHQPFPPDVVQRRYSRDHVPIRPKPDGNPTEPAGLFLFFQTRVQRHSNTLCWGAEGTRAGEGSRRIGKGLGMRFGWTFRSPQSSSLNGPRLDFDRTPKLEGAAPAKCSPSFTQGGPSHYGPMRTRRREFLLLSNGAGEGTTHPPWGIVYCPCLTSINSLTKPIFKTLGI
ncbi:hypothetical protein B0H63DRAFT_487658 [Podospora didyma]|uniref:Uncharacterized protein n=1 Tax=Podospora didyma TaxID=330526 RepID=A0AAE0K1Z3_9PEZI|nr:hypothetical protein B0H63DRAFT_487658 [Podospora didyma]